MISLIFSLFIIPFTTFIFSLVVQDLWKLSKWLLSKTKPAVKRIISFKNKPDSVPNNVDTITIYNAKHISKINCNSIDSVLLRNHFGEMYDYIYVSFKNDRDFKVKQLETGHMLFSINGIKNILRNDQPLLVS